MNSLQTRVCEQIAGDSTRTRVCKNNKLVCEGVNSNYKMTVQFVEGLGAAVLDKVTATAVEECLKTTELFTELNPDFSERA